MLLLSEANTEVETMTPTMTERRRGLRIRQSRPVKVFEPVARRYLAGRTRDVSAAGLRIELPASAAVMPGTVLNIHVGLNRKGESLANRRRMIPARVIWTDRPTSSRGPKLVAGIEFLAGIAAHLDAA